MVSRTSTSHRKPHQPGYIPGSEQASPAAWGLVLIDDALTALKKLPSGYAQCCITSPPYWGLRDYELPLQIGVEGELRDYLRKLSKVFAEVSRVLRPDGTLWVNIGDSYTSGNRGWRAPDPKNSSRAMSMRPSNPKGLKEKELVGVPWRLAFELQRYGWFLRSDIVWYKPNAQPESVKDRPTQSHEYVFLLAKSKRYYYDQAAIREPTADRVGEKNRRSVWTFKVRPGPGPRVTSFPDDLVRLCVLAGSRPADVVIDPFFGGGTVGLACLAENRKFIGIELNPLYAELATSRALARSTNVNMLGRDGPASSRQIRLMLGDVD